MEGGTPGTNGGAGRIEVILLGTGKVNVFMKAADQTKEKERRSDAALVTRTIEYPWFPCRYVLYILGFFGYYRLYNRFVADLCQTAESNPQPHVCVAL